MQYYTIATTRDGITKYPAWMVDGDVRTSTQIENDAEVLTDDINKASVWLVRDHAQASADHLNSKDKQYEVVEI